MRWLLATMLAALPALADIAPVITWPVDVTRQAPYPLTIRRGETVILQPTYNQDLTGTDTVVLKARASGAAQPSSVTGSVYSATGGVARIRLDVTLAVGVYQYEIALISTNATNLRGNGTLTIIDSMAGEIATTPPSGTGDTLAPSEPEGTYPNDIAPVLAWTVRPDTMTAYNLQLMQGETAILEPTFDGMDFTGAAAVALRYRPTGASGWHYVAPGAIHDATTGVVRVRWDSTVEGTNNTYQYEIAVQSADAMLIRSYGTITIRPSLSGSSTSMPTRVTAFDWATVDHSNIGAAPFLSAVALAPFASFWASLTNGTADLNVQSLLIDGVPVGTGGVMRGSGTYTNTMINGISHTGAVSIVAGSNTTWRLVNGSWRVDVPTIAGPAGPAGTNGAPGTNVMVFVGSEVGPVGPAGRDGRDGLPGADGVIGRDGLPGLTPTISITDTLTGDAACTNVGNATNVVLQFTLPPGPQGEAGPGMTNMPAVWDADLIGTNALYYKVNGETTARFDSNGLTMFKGSLQLYEEDLDCNVRLYDGTRLAPSLSFMGHTNEFGMYARGWNGAYGAGWSMGGVEIGILHGSGITLMSTNFAFTGKLIGDISQATGYPEPVFEAWRTNMQFSSLSISNLTIANGPINVNDSMLTPRATIDTSGLTVRDAGGTTRSTVGMDLNIRNSSGLTTTKLDTGLTLYDPTSGMPLVVLNEYGQTWKASNGYTLLDIYPSHGYRAYDQGTYALRAQLNYAGLTILSATSQLVFRVDSQASLLTTMNTAAITNSGNLAFYGANGTNLCTITGVDGAIKIRGVDSDTRYAKAPTGMTAFIITNVFAGVTNRLWFTSQGICTNHTP